MIRSSLAYSRKIITSSFFPHFQEDSQKTGKVTSAGMYFLHFQVYRMDSTVNAVCMFCYIALVFMLFGPDVM
jgi:hypothetical protein